jgi:hypothetical protein
MLLKPAPVEALPELSTVAESATEEPLTSGAPAAASTEIERSGISEHVFEDGVPHVPVVQV